MSNGKLGFWSKMLNHDEIFEKPITYTKVGGKSAIPESSDSPAPINLIRAVYDEAGKVVARIDRELIAMERKREQLLQNRAAHIELFEVAKKYVSQETKQ